MPHYIVEGICSKDWFPNSGPQKYFIAFRETFRKLKNIIHVCIGKLTSIQPGGINVLEPHPYQITSIRKFVQYLEKRAWNGQFLSVLKDRSNDHERLHQRTVILAALQAWLNTPNISGRFESEGRVSRASYHRNIRYRAKHIYIHIHLEPGNHLTGRKCRTIIKNFEAVQVVLAGVYFLERGDAARLGIILPQDLKKQAFWIS